MQDLPSATELLEAIAAFLQEDAAEELSPRKRFFALVAANVARVVAREIELSPAQLDRECSQLWSLLGKPGQVPAQGERRALALELNRELCRRIRAGDADSEPWRSRVLVHLREQVLDKLAIANPGFASSPDSPKR